jgi:hypothetical protein
VTNGIAILPIVFTANAASVTMGCDGNLPEGLTSQKLNSTLIIEGTPTVIGWFSYTVWASDGEIRLNLTCDISVKPNLKDLRLPFPFLVVIFGAIFFILLASLVTVIVYVRRVDWLYDNPTTFSPWKNIDFDPFFDILYEFDYMLR